MRSLRCLRHLLTAAVLLGIALHAYARQPENDTGEEYRVYEAALAALDPAPDAGLHVAIYRRTLSGTCGKEGRNPVLAKGCTFLWIKPDTADDVEQLLRSRWHKFSKSAWKNFLMKNASSVVLHEPIRTPWKHRLFGEDVGGETLAKAVARPRLNADRVIYLSQVGFNSKRTDAILYVLVFSYDGGVAATGDYLRLRRPKRRHGERGPWTLAGRVNYFSGAKDRFASLEPPPPVPPAQSALLSARLRQSMERK